MRSWSVVHSRWSAVGRRLTTDDQSRMPDDNPPFLAHLPPHAALRDPGNRVPLAGLDSVHAQIEISEFVARNIASLADNDRAFSDWIELHNTTDQDES